MPAAHPCPNASPTKPFRVVRVLVDDVRVSEDGVFSARRIWWFLAPAHRDQWIALGHSPVTPAASPARWLRRRTHAELNNRCAMHGLPLRAIKCDPQRTGELQLLAHQAMRPELRAQIGPRRSAARVAAVRDALLEDANKRRTSISKP